MELVGSDIASASAITKPPHSWGDMSRLLFLRGEDNKDKEDNNKINNKNSEDNEDELKTVKLEAYTPDDNAGILLSFQFDPGIVQVSSRYYPGIIQDTSSRLSNLPLESFSTQPWG